MKVIYRIRRIMDKIIPAVASVFFSMGVISALLGAVTRTFTHSSGFTWVDEFTRYTMIWATMLVIGISMRKGTMTVFSLVIDKLPRKIELCFKLLIQLLVIGFYVLIFYFGLLMALNNDNMETYSLGIPMMYVYMVWPISAFFVIYEGLTCVYEMILSLLGKTLLPPDAVKS